MHGYHGPMPCRRPFLLGLVIALGMATVSGCGGDDDRQVVTVAAASSLTDAFEAIAADFEADHPGVEVRLTFGSSTTLADQIVGGVGADVLATADADAMAIVDDAGLLATDPEPFAGNVLVAVTRAGDPPPFGPEGLDVDVVAACASDAPCGRLADRELDPLLDAGTLRPDQITRAPNARATLTAVVEGDADAALVYASDAVSAGDAVTAHELTVDQQAPDTTYPIAVLDEAGDPALARAFVDLVRGERGQELLDAEGFATTLDGWQW